MRGFLSVEGGVTKLAGKCDEATRLEGSPIWFSEKGQTLPYS